MKLHTSVNQFYQTITAYETDFVKINDVSFNTSLLVTPTTAPVSLNIDDYKDLSSAIIEQMMATAPDVVLLGTGKQQHFLPGNLSKVFLQKNIGIETMSNDAACRTYNILMAEGRKVTLCLIFENQTASA